MNILYSSIAGQNKGPASTHRKVLTQQGHRVIWVTSPSKGGKPDDPADVPELGLPVGISLQNVLRHIGVKPDFFLYVEPMGLIPEGLEYAPFPTACIIRPLC